MNKINKLAIVLVIILGIIVIISIVNYALLGDLKYLLRSLLALVCLTIPFLITIIANKKSILLPSRFQEITLIFLFLTQYLGEVKKFYLKIWWWDLLIHIIFGIYSVIIALHFIRGIIIKDHKATKERFKILISLFAFSFSVAMGTLWEMFEYVGDYLVGSSMIKGGLDDTATDLLVKIASAFITTLICYHRKINDYKD